MLKTTEYTIIIYAPKDFHILQKILDLFFEKLITIKSLNVSELVIEEVNKIVIVTEMNKPQVSIIVKLLKNKLYLDRVIYQVENKTIYQEIGLFKIKADSFLSNNSIQNIIDAYYAKIVYVTSNFFVIAKTGTSSDILKFYNEIFSFGLIEFNRSGRVALTDFY